MSAKPKFKLVCFEQNPRHTKFTLRDRSGAHCGTLVILTSDLDTFMSKFWNGPISLEPEKPIAKPYKPNQKHEKNLDNLGSPSSRSVERSRPASAERS